MTRKTEDALLRQHGFVRGMPDETRVECEECKRAISGTRVWWLPGIPYCRPCAMFASFVRRAEA